jgi:ABC-type transporter Mla MlaB component
MATQLLLNAQMFKIRRFEDMGVVTLALSGRIEEEQLPQLQRLLEVESEAKTTDIVLDLVDVRLVDRQAIKFLATCEARGILLKNCPSYVREWIETGKGYEQ